MNINVDLKKYVKKVTRNFDPFVVETYSVIPTNAKGGILKRGPDDQTYINFPELINIVPRGCSDLYCDGKLIQSLRGLTKFDGTTNIDEDEAPYEGALEDERTSSFLDSKKIDEWESKGILETSFQEKANGKFAICRIFEHEGKRWMFGGSKNVHVVVPFDEEIKGTDLHFDILKAIKKEVVNKVKEIINKTLVGEYVDGMHLVYTEQPYIVFFDHTLSLNKTRDVLPSICTKPTTQMLKQIREMTDQEGVVIMYKNKDTGEICRQKHKTIWYIILRSWRESISFKKRTNAAELSNLLKTKLMSRNQTYLHLSEDQLNYWYLEADKFSQWFFSSHYQFSDVGPFSKIGMARVWKDYTLRNEKKEQRKEEIKEEEVKEEEEKEVKEYLECIEYYDSILPLSKKVPVLVIMRGLPGTGKSTVAKKLYDVLTFNNVTCEIFNTDSYFIDQNGVDQNGVNQNGVYRFDEKMLHENHQKNLDSFLKSTAHVKIVDNTNLGQKEYQPYYYDAVVKKGYVCICLCTKLDSLDVLVKRNIHQVPLRSLDRMCSKYNGLKNRNVPMYIGAFPSQKDINISYEQKTPLHVTCEFLGGHPQKSQVIKYLNLLGTCVDFEITGISKNECGVAYVCDNPLIDGNHITLSTFEGKKPVDVGTHIKPENITNIQPFHISCIISAMF